MMIVGIDPGLSGAIALYRPEPGSLVITDLPTQTRRMSNKKLRPELDLAALAHWLDTHLPLGDVHAYIEDPHAMPKQGITSAFRFGYVCGAIQAMITAYHIPMTLLPPATWKKALGLSSDKRRANSCPTTRISGRSRSTTAGRKPRCWPGTERSG